MKSSEKKILGRLKLNQLSKNVLDQRSMNSLKGGSNCDPCPFMTGAGYVWDHYCPLKKDKVKN